MEIVLLISFGIIGGIFGGMGMGGGTVLIPLLTIFLSINQKLAQGYNLLAFLLMAIFAIIIHSKNKLIDLKSIIVLDIFGIIFCVLGSLLVSVVENKVLHYVFAVFLIILALIEIVKIIKENKKNKDM